jgi:hypothetical protein
MGAGVSHADQDTHAQMHAAVFADHTMHLYCKCMQTHHLAALWRLCVARVQHLVVGLRGVCVCCERDLHDCEWLVLCWHTLIGNVLTQRAATLQQRA